MTETLDTRLKASNYRPSGFDYMRNILSLSVVLAHSFAISYSAAFDAVTWASPARPFIKIVLPMFFALSGFLVAASMERSNTLLKFLGLRVIRIFPALVVEVILSAFLLGAIMTTLPLKDYFTHPLFFNYMWNLVGHPQYFLPGVFATNPVPNVVNGQLWTVPFELLCYVSLSGLALLGLKRFRIVAPLGAAGFMLAWITYKLVKHHGLFPPMPGRVSGAILICCFLLGVSFYFYRDKVLWNRALCAACGLFSIVALWFPYGEYLAFLPIAYFTVALGLFNPRKIGVLQNADYSYGVFIYGYVIQQTVAAVLPWSREWYLNASISMAIALVVAAISWHFVEKPALKLRGRLEKLEAFYLRLRAPKAGAQGKAALTSVDAG